MKQINHTHVSKTQLHHLTSIQCCKSGGFACIIMPVWPYHIICSSAAWSCHRSSFMISWIRWIGRWIGCQSIGRYMKCQGNIHLSYKGSKAWRERRDYPHKELAILLRPSSPCEQFNHHGQVSEFSSKLYSSQWNTHWLYQLTKHTHDSADRLELLQRHSTLHMVHSSPQRTARAQDERCLAVDYRKLFLLHRKVYWMDVMLIAPEFLTTSMTKKMLGTKKNVKALQELAG